MENTLHNGDNLIVDKLSYRFVIRSVLILLYFRFSIRQIHIILNVSSDYPGETVQIMEDGSIYINGEKWRSPTEEK